MSQVVVAIEGLECSCMGEGEGSTDGHCRELAGERQEYTGVLVCTLDSISSGDLDTRDISVSKRTAVSAYTVELVHLQGHELGLVLLSAVTPPRFYPTNHTGSA